MKRYLTKLALATSAAALIGSAAHADTYAFMRAGPDPFYQYGMEAVQMAAEQLGDEIVTYNANNDSTQELANIQDAITQGVDGILIYAVSLSSEKAAIAQAQRAGVPIFFEYGYDPELLDKVAGFMQIDVPTFGVPVGKFVGETVKEGKVAIISGKLGRGDAEAYSEGFKKGLTESGSKAEVVSEVPGDWNRQMALDATAQILTAHPDLKALYVHNDDMAVGASIAIERAGKTGEVLLASGTNGAPYGLELIKEGKLAVSHANPPSSASVMAYRLLKGVVDGSVEPGQYYDAPSTMITKDNVDEAQPWDPSKEQVAEWVKMPLPEPVKPAPGTN
ncbi:sugar ABC transporter substrate-binding protein [Jiella avicenniae]|uniref:Sugar ABC transporter substrate-binding protein n=1 Tax=Jiella avicenniae TaxID=2907202 RepID=A0A9X1P368_9HYPH|nr:sugar ABC transporter substrate-binding protein [Jiella avicenniae]MCE7029663.1 sugar ABC transporter substrate-binding protein [Jiella avicenniae]